MSEKDSSEAPSLERRLTRLDEIVARLEGGDIELEEGLRLFEEGVGHLREAESILSTAELRVQELIDDAEGLGLRAFEGGGE
jgi:exodeoxyribonuclease VII small subunit